MVGDQVADDRILELFLDGHTVVLQGLHRLWPPVIDFAGALTTDLGHPVQVNAYITPPSSTGFSAHYDVHDVFVLQIAGEKRWRIHEPVLVDPLRNQPWEDRAAAVAARAAEQPLIDAVLRPGDALYLPRGFLHAAEALGEMSIHLTVGVHPVTRHAVLEALTALAADEPALRSSLPLGVDVSDPAQIEADVAATAEALVDRLRTRDRSRRSPTGWPPGSCRATAPAPISPLRQAGQASRLDADTVLEVRPHLRHALRFDERPRRPHAPRPAAASCRSPRARRSRRFSTARGCAVADLPGLDRGRCPRPRPATASARRSSWSSTGSDGRRAYRHERAALLVRLRAAGRPGDRHGRAVLGHGARRAARTVGQAGAGAVTARPGGRFGAQRPGGGDGAARPAHPPPRSRAGADSAQVGGRGLPARPRGVPMGDVRRRRRAARAARSTAAPAPRRTSRRISSARTAGTTPAARSAAGRSRSSLRANGRKPCGSARTSAVTGSRPTC